MRTEVKPWSFIWLVTTPVGGPACLGTLCSSNWGISFFLFLFFFYEGAWIDPLLFSLSLCLSLSPFHQAESCGLAPSHWQIPLLSFCFLVFTKSLETFCLLFPPELLMFCLFSLPLSDLSVGEWQQDSSSGNTSRVLSYTIALNNPLGPKTAPVVETQVSPWQTVFFFLVCFII